MNESKGKSMTFQEYLSKVEELQLSEGWIITEKFEHLGSTFHIFNINHKELLANIEQFKKPESLLLWDVRNKKEMDFFLKEVTRQLHNFVAGAKTFVDHTRIIAKELYENTEFWTEYETQVKQQFVLNPLVQFVHDLRNYILHRDLPLAFASLTFEINWSLRISLKDMRKWKEWKPLSKQYINSKDDELIEYVINDYSKSIFSFHDWLYDRQLEIHKEAFDETNKIKFSIENSSWHIKMK